MMTIDRVQILTLVKVIRTISSAVTNPPIGQARKGLIVTPERILRTLKPGAVSSFITSIGTVSLAITFPFLVDAES